MQIIFQILITFLQVNGLNKNPNDITASIYDKVIKPLKPGEVTDEEISLVNSLVEPGSKILDIGGGTGRHSITLAKEGYKISVVDSSLGMLNNLTPKIEKLKLKKENIQVFYNDIFDKDFDEDSFDFIILFWNSFNEIVLTDEQAELFFEKVSKWLTKDGGILINIDDSEKVNPANFDFKTTYQEDGYTYKLHWKTKSYDSKTNTSVSLESIDMLDKDNKLLDSFKNKIIQRYWSLEELENFARNSAFKIERLKFKLNEELYLLLTRS